MDDIELCPPWWPLALWRLHFQGLPWEKEHFDPRNKPAPTNRLLVALNAHVSTYMMGDEKSVKQIRNAAIKEMREAIEQLAAE